MEIFKRKIVRIISRHWIFLHIIFLSAVVVYQINKIYTKSIDENAVTLSMAPFSIMIVGLLLLLLFGLNKFNLKAGITCLIAGYLITNLSYIAMRDASLEWIGLDVPHNNYLCAQEVTVHGP